MMAATPIGQVYIPTALVVALALIVRNLLSATAAIVLTYCYDEWSYGAENALTK